RFLTFVERLFVDIDTPVDAIPLLLPGEESELTRFERGPRQEWAKGLAGDHTLLDLFSTRVSEIPNCVAIVDDQRELTYRAFGERVRHLSSFLFASGL